MYKKYGVITIGIDENIITNDTIYSNTFEKNILYILNKFFETAIQTNKIIPEEIVFWSKAILPDEFKQKMNGIAMIINYKFELNYDGFLFKPYNKNDHDFYMMLDELLHYHNIERFYFIYDDDGVIYDMTAIYEEYYKSSVEDVIFIVIEQKGHIASSFIHTPFIFSNILF